MSSPRRPRVVQDLHLPHLILPNLQHRAADILLLLDEGQHRLGHLLRLDPDVLDRVDPPQLLRVLRPQRRLDDARRDAVDADAGQVRPGRRLQVGEGADEVGDAALGRDVEGRRDDGPLGGDGGDVDDGAGRAALEEVRDGLLGCVDGVDEVDIEAGVPAAVGGVFGDGRSGRVPEIGEGLGRVWGSDTETQVDGRGRG